MEQVLSDSQPGIGQWREGEGEGGVVLPYHHSPISTQPTLSSKYVTRTFRISFGCLLQKQKRILIHLSTSLLERHGDSSLHESNSNLALGGGVEPAEEATIALSVTWPFSTPLSSDAAPTSSYPGMSAQISNSCGENLIGSVWVRWLCLGPIPMTRRLKYYDWPGVSHSTPPPQPRAWE